MKNELNKESVLEFLKNNSIVTIATMSSDNKPHSSVVACYVDDDFNLYFATNPDTYKSKNLQENPHASFSVWELGGLYIQADCDVSVVSDEDYNDIFDKLAVVLTSKKDLWPPLFRSGDGEYIIFKLKTKWLRVLDLEGQIIREGESPFVEIIK